MDTLKWELESLEIPWEGGLARNGAGTFPGEGGIRLFRMNYHGLLIRNFSEVFKSGSLKNAQYFCQVAPKKITRGHSRPGTQNGSKHRQNFCLFP